MESNSVVPAGRGGSETLPLMSSSNLGSSNVVPLLLGTAEAPTHTLLEVMVDVGMESVKLRSVSTAAGTVSAARQENNNNIQAAAAASWVDATTAGICSSSSSSFRRTVDQAGDAGRGGDIQQARCSSSRSGAGEYSFRESFRRLTSATSFVRQLSQELPFLPRNSSRVQASNSPDLFDPELAKASLSPSPDEYSSTSTSSPPEQQQRAAAAAAATGGRGMVRTVSGAEYALEGLRFISQATATADQKYQWEAVETRFKRLASCDNTLARSNFAECIGKKKSNTQNSSNPAPLLLPFYGTQNATFFLPAFLPGCILLLLLLLLRITRMSIVTTQFSSHNKTAFFELQLLCHEELQCFFCCINPHELQLTS